MFMFATAMARKREMEVDLPLKGVFISYNWRCFSNRLGALDLVGWIVQLGTSHCAVIPASQVGGSSPAWRPSKTNGGFRRITPFHLIGWLEAFALLFSSSFCLFVFFGLFLKEHGRKKLRIQ
jgi:hypothetical protein